MEVVMQQDHLEILLEEMNSKFTLVLEGHSALHKVIQDSRQEFSEKLDLVNFKIEVLNDKIDAVETRLIDKIDAVETCLNDKIEAVQKNLGRKIDAVADDLAAHRADTEAHHGLYLVKE
jgi:hypothetical protein